MDVGFGVFLYSITIVLNIHFLPWNGGQNGRKITQSVETWKKFASSTHPIFQHFLETIGHEKGITHIDLIGPSGANMVWNAFLDSECLNTAGQKVGICRWAQAFVYMKRLFPDWSSLLVALIRANLDEKWMQSSVFSGIAVEQVEVQSTMPGVGEQRVQTKLSVAEEIRELRKIVKKHELCHEFSGQSTASTNV